MWIRFKRKVVHTVTTKADNGYVQRRNTEKNCSDTTYVVWGN